VKAKRMGQRQGWSFRDKFDILLEKRPSSVAGLRHTMLYGKSQFMFFKRVNGKCQIRMFKVAFLLPEEDYEFANKRFNR